MGGETPLFLKNPPNGEVGLEEGKKGPAHNIAKKGVLKIPPGSLSREARGGKTLPLLKNAPHKQRGGGRNLQLPPEGERRKSGRRSSREGTVSKKGGGRAVS